MAATITKFSETGNVDDTASEAVPHFVAHGSEGER